MKLMSYLFVTGIIVLFSFLYNPISLSATTNQAIFREVGDIGEKKASEQGLTVPVYQKANRQKNIWFRRVSTRTSISS